MQKRKSSLPIILGVLAALVLLTACCAIILTTGVLAFLVPARADVTPMIDLDFEPSLPTEPEIFPFSDLPGMPIQDVQVETIVGSPAAVFVIASGEWGGLCSQLAETQIRYAEGNQIHIELLSDPGREDCMDVTMALPFSFRIPLNMVEMPSGKYSVIVNGVQADFDWTGSTFSAEGHFPDFSQPSPGGLPPINLNDVRVEFGLGSPIPVEVAVSGDWPSLCSQLGRTTTNISGKNIDISLEATPHDDTCPPDYLGLTFGLRLPLNMVEMPEGEYTVTVNGWQTSFAWPPTGEPAPTPVDLGAAEPVRMVYVGPDGNLLLICILRGGVPFLVDLSRYITAPHMMDFMAVSSYGVGKRESDGAVRLAMDLQTNVRDKDVLLVEDIVDSGHTIASVLELLQLRQPRSLKVCALLDKAERREAVVPIHYRGFEIPNKFVFGYGLDLDEYYRNLPFVGVVDLEKYKPPS